MSISMIVRSFLIALHVFSLLSLLSLIVVISVLTSHNVVFDPSDIIWWLFNLLVSETKLICIFGALWLTKSRKQRIRSADGFAAFIDLISFLFLYCVKSLSVWMFFISLQVGFSLLLAVFPAILLFNGLSDIYLLVIIWYFHLFSGEVASVQWGITHCWWCSWHVWLLHAVLSALACRLLLLVFAGVELYAHKLLHVVWIHSVGV